MGTSGTQETDSTGAGVKIDQALQRIEGDLIDIRAAASSLDRADPSDRLCDLERRLFDLECRHAREVRAPREHPALPVLRAWAERLRRHELTDPAAESESLAAALLCRSLRERERLRDEGAEWRAAGADPDVAGGLRDRVFDALMATEEVRSSVEGRARRIGPATELDTRTVVDEARRVQEGLRAELERLVAAAPPDEGCRDEWAGRLVDHADEALVAALEVNARVGARVLGEARRALLWHVERIEVDRHAGEQPDDGD